LKEQLSRRLEPRTLLSSNMADLGPFKDYNFLHDKAINEKKARENAENHLCLLIDLLAVTGTKMKPLDRMSMAILKEEHGETESTVRYVFCTRLPSVCLQSWFRSRVKRLKKRIAVRGGVVPLSRGVARVRASERVESVSNGIQWVII
jgi:hypothetical protein